MPPSKLKSGACVFCLSRSEPFGNTPDFKRLAGKRAGSRLLYETRHFAVIPTLGQIVEGYLMIMPKAHYRSFASMTGELLGEAEAVYGAVRLVLRGTYADPVFFEHGMGRPTDGADGGGGCIDHAHIHAVPAPVALTDKLRQRFRWTTIKSLRDLPVAADGSSYLFVDDHTHEKRVYPASNLPAQYLRHVVAERLDVPDKGDWAIYPGVDELVNTLKKLTPWPA